MNKLGERNFDIIRQFLQKPTDEDVLTEVQAELLSRWTFAWNNMMLHKSPEKVWPMITKTFKVSRTTAYRDIEYAGRLMGNINIVKAYSDVLLWNSLVAGLNRAILSGNSTAEARILGVIEKYNTRLGLSKESDYEGKEGGMIVTKITATPEEAGLKRQTKEDMIKLRNLVAAQKNLEVADLMENKDGSWSVKK